MNQREDPTAALPLDPEGEDAEPAGCVRPREFRKAGRLTDGQRAMVEANLGLVWEVAHAKFRGWLTPEERADYGLAGLIEAAMDFDPSRGFKFSTFAWMRIARKIQRARFAGLDLLIATPVREGGRDVVRAFQEGGDRPGLSEVPGAERPATVDVDRFWSEVRRALEGKPQTGLRDAEIVEMHYRHGWTVAQLAKRFSLDRHSITYALRRSRVRLAQLNPKGLQDSIVEIG